MFRSFSALEKVAVFASALLIAGVIYFWIFGERTLTQRTGEYVGSVIELKNDARFKAQTEISWKKAKVQMFVFENDQYFVGPDSSLRIRFLSGEEILLQANSLISIRTRGSKLELNLAMGAARVTNAKNITGDISAPKTIVFVSEKRLKLKPQEAQPDFQDADPAPIAETEASTNFTQVVESVEVDNLTEVETEVTNISDAEPIGAPPEVQAEVANVKTTEPVTEAPKISEASTPLPATPATPRPVKERYKLQHLQNVEVNVERARAADFEGGTLGKISITWQKPTKVKGDYQISVYPKGKQSQTFFSKEEFFEISQPESTQMKISVKANMPLQRGVSSVNQEGIEISLQSPDQLNEIKIISPASNQIFILSGGAKLSIPFRLQIIEGAVEYRVQIANEKSFKNPLFELKGSSAVLVFNNRLNVGTYFMRTKVLKEYAVSPWSAPSNFVVMAP